MGHHHKAASCSAIPSFQSFTSDSTSTTQTPSLNFYEHDYTKQQQHSTLKRSLVAPLTKSMSEHSLSDTQKPQLFPLPSFCLYSKRALTNEYAPESDIIQFLHPISTTLEERLPMFVGVLQSLFTVVNDMPFTNDSDDEEEEEEEEEEEQSEEDKKNPFTIIGLSSMKLVIWNHMCDNRMDSNAIIEKDLCLVVMISSQVTDSIILKNMRLLRENIMSSTTSMTLTANQMGEQLIPLIDYWFDTDL